jgi:hypothetical protein
LSEGGFSYRKRRERTCLVGVRTETEVLDRLARVLGTTEKDDVGTGRRAEGELVEGEALTTSLLDASTGCGGEAESADADLGDLEETVVIGDGADDGADLALVGLAAVLVGRHGDDLGERERRGVDLGHAQSFSQSQYMTLVVSVPKSLMLLTDLLKTVALNLLSVRRCKKLYNLCNSFLYGLVLWVA